MAKFALAQIAEWIGCQWRGDQQVLGFKQDSSRVLPGELFFAFKGEKTDGHTHLKEVAAKGAVGAVVSKDYQGPDHGLILLKVDSVMAALHKLAKIVHESRGTRVVATTGSVGKTTTKEFMATLLEGKFKVGKTPGNENSQVGMPLSILNATGEEEVFVMEMAMSLPGEIKKLVAIAPPEIALITKIALVHAVFFTEGLEGIAAAKAEILSHPLTRLGFLNHQVAAFSAAQQGSCQKLTYATAEEAADCDFVLCREGEQFYVLEQGERSPSFSLPFSANHLCENFLGAAVVARAMGMTWAEIIPQLPKLKTYMRRFERVEKQGIIFLNDSYNATVVSMRAALVNLPKPHPGKKKIAVLGAMKELGPYTEQCHKEVAQIAFDHVDYLLCLGEECAPMVERFQKGGKPVEYFDDLQAIKQRVFEVAESGDVVLLKGSNSKRLWQVLE